MKEHRHQASSQLPSNIHLYRPTYNGKPWLYHLGIRQRIYLYFIFANEDGDINFILKYNDQNGVQFNNTQRTSKWISLPRSIYGAIVGVAAKFGLLRPRVYNRLNIHSDMHRTRIVWPLKRTNNRIKYYVLYSPPPPLSTIAVWICLALTFTTLHCMYIYRWKKLDFRKLRNYLFICHENLLRPDWSRGNGWWWRIIKLLFSLGRVFFFWCPGWKYCL